MVREIKPQLEPQKTEVTLKTPQSQPQERSVGLIIMTELLYPEPGLPKQLMAVLQRRGERNHEKGFQVESWPGLCQVTAHGKLKPDEFWKDALKQEIREELGQRVSDWIEAYILSSNEGVILLNEVGDDDSPKRTRTYGTRIPASVIQTVRLNGSTGGLVFVDRERLARIQTTTGTGNLFDRAMGIPLRDQIVMFPDELEALMVAFREFGKNLK